MNFWYWTACIFLLAGFPYKKDTTGLKPVKAYKDSTATSFFRRQKGWIAGDGALSIPLSTHKVLWLFGDSHIDDLDPETGTTPCLFQVRNSGMLQSMDDWRWQHTQTLTGSGPGFKSFFKNNPDNQYWFWPGAGFQLKDTVYVFLSSLKRTGSGAWGWGKGGTDMWGKITVQDMKIVAYSPLQDFDSISFGQGFVKDKKAGYIYAYGSRPDFVTGKLFVARIPIAHPNALWEFWNGKGWNKNIKDAVPIAEGASNSIHVSRIKDQYVMLSTEFSVGCDQGKRIFAAISSNPTGPFSKRKTIYTINDTLQGHYPFFYFAIAHPEYINDKNEILVTYSINGYGDCINTCVNGRFDPDDYRPRAIRVPLQLLFSVEGDQ